MQKTLDFRLLLHICEIDDLSYPTLIKKPVEIALPGCAKCTILIWAHGLSRKAAALNCLGCVSPQPARKGVKATEKGGCFYRDAKEL